MKKAFFLSLVLLIMSTYVLDAQTYNVKKYCWGSFTGRTYSWGKVKKANFDIVLDFDARTILVNGPKKSVSYTILDEHPTVLEREAQDRSGKIYCVMDDSNSRQEFYFREANGVVTQIIYFQGGSYWLYVLE